MHDYHVDIFPWSDSFNTGDTEIDQQHQHLVQLLNKLASYVAFDGQQVDVHEFLDELIDYTVYHFESEERLWMADIPEHPQAIAHIKSHQDFIEYVAQLRGEAESLPSEKWMETVLSFLTRWLASHITGE